MRWALTYTSYLFDSDFELRLPARNPSTTLAIVDDPGLTNSFSNVSSYVAAGGGRFSSTAASSRSRSLAAALDATAVNSFTSPLPVYDWGGPSFLTGLTSPVDFAEESAPVSLTASICNRRSRARRSPASAAQPPTIGPARSSLAIQGERFWMVSYSTTADATAIVQFAENEILSLYGSLTTQVSISPTTATFVNGVWTGNVTVSQAISSMYLRIDDGSGHLGDGNAFAVAATGGSFANQRGTVTNNLTGSSGLSKTGSGVLTLSGVNNYTGGTTVSEGTLIITNSSSRCLRKAS